MPIFNTYAAEEDLVSFRRRPKKWYGEIGRERIVSRRPTKLTAKVIGRRSAPEIPLRRSLLVL